jgi:hypothetical protein
MSLSVQLRPSIKKDILKMTQNIHNYAAIQFSLVNKLNLKRNVLCKQFISPYEDSQVMKLSKQLAYKLKVAENWVFSLALVQH